MLKHFMRFLIILITMQLCIGDVYAIGENEDCSAEDAVCDPSFWCQPIPEGQPGAGGKTCQPCTNGPTDKEGKRCGDTDAACQYNSNGGDSNNCKWTMTCPKKTGEEFPGGQWLPDERSITYNGTGEPPSCTYDNTDNITCDDIGGTICTNYGFHQGGAENDKCIENVKYADISVSCPAGSLIFYGDSSGECLVSSCSDGYSLQPIEGIYRKCEQNGELVNYGLCKKNQIPCAQSDRATTLTSVCQEQGATLSDNATLIAGTLSYDYSGCKCTKTITPEHAPSGSGTYSCNFLSDGSKIDESTCTTTISQCNAGFCIVDNSTPPPSCEEVPSGYYKTGSLNTGCVKCPAGASSDVGNTKTTKNEACYYTSATQFRDSTGRFSIPATNIKIKWD